MHEMISSLLKQFSNILNWYFEWIATQFIYRDIIEDSKLPVKLTDIIPTLMRAQN